MTTHRLTSRALRRIDPQQLGSLSHELFDGVLRECVQLDDELARLLLARPAIRRAAISGVTARVERIESVSNRAIALYGSNGPGDDDPNRLQRLETLVEHMESAHDAVNDAARGYFHADDQPQTVYAQGRQGQNAQAPRS